MAKSLEVKISHPKGLPLDFVPVPLSGRYCLCWAIMNESEVRRKVGYHKDELWKVVREKCHRLEFTDSPEQRTRKIERADRVFVWHRLALSRAAAIACDKCHSGLSESITASALSAAPAPAEPPVSFAFASSGDKGRSSS
jgi:hypothetical protein